MLQKSARVESSQETFCRQSLDRATQIRLSKTHYEYDSTAVIYYLSQMRCFRMAVELCKLSIVLGAEETKEWRSCSSLISKIPRVLEDVVKPQVKDILVTSWEDDDIVRGMI